MSRISAYLARTVLSSVLMVLLLLVGLDLVFAYVGELDELRGNYHLSQAVIYILTTAPRRVYDLLPMSCLLGCIMGLGTMASSSELTVMRAAGVSVFAIVRAIFAPALLLVLIGLALGQYVIPTTEALAESRKSLERWGYSSIVTLSGQWHREGNTFIHINSVAPNGALYGVSRFEYDNKRMLLRAGFAEKALFTGLPEVVTAAPASGPGSVMAGKPAVTGKPVPTADRSESWVLENERVTTFLPDGSTRRQTLAVQHWQTGLTPRTLAFMVVEPEYLSLTQLWQFAHYLDEQGLNAGAHHLRFWRKLLDPLATLAMVLLAVSYIFGPLRSVSVGLRIMTGVISGVLFRYLQDFAGYAGLVYDFPPLLAATLPIVVALGLGVGLLRRAG